MSTSEYVFNTDILPENVADLLREAEAEIYSALEVQTKTVISIGRSLAVVKSEIEHGQYGDWITSKFPFSIRTAQKYIAAYEKLGEHQALLQRFSTSTLYALSESKIDDVRDMVLEEIQAGLSSDRQVKERLTELVANREAEAKNVAPNEAPVDDVLVFFSAWPPEQVAKLIAVLRKFSAQDLADRLEGMISNTSDEGNL